MRQTKEDVVNRYQEEYLSGRPDDVREAFFQKPVATRYSAIMAWKRRNELRNKRPEGLSAADVIRHATSLAGMIETTDNFTDKEMERMHAAIDQAKEALNNFYRIRYERELRQLERSRDEIQQRIDEIRSKI